MSQTSALRFIEARGELCVPVPLTAPFPSLDVTPGTAVSRGDAIAEAPRTAPAPLAPANAQVAGVTRAMLTNGHEAPAILLQPSVDQPEPPSTPDDGPGRLTHVLRALQSAPDLGRFTDKLRLAGVWADRWTSPDLLGQLLHALKRPTDTVICNALDLDDALPLQGVVAAEHATEIVAAVAAIAAVTGATRGLVAVDDTTPDACRAAIDRYAGETGVRAAVVRNSYPQPNPTLLLHRLTGRALRPGRLPTEAGAIVLDAVAAAAVGRCVLYDEPMLRTPLGLADMESGRHQLLSVPIGMRLSDVLSEAGIASTDLEFRGGSPLREVRLPRDCVIAGGEVTLYLVGAQPSINPQPCIRCGWCTAGCPVRIHPAGILQAAQVGDRTAGEGYGLDACIECGVCTYVCPSRLPLLAGIRSLKEAPRAGA